MDKNSIFITRNDFPTILYELLKEKFEIFVWDSREKDVIPKTELLKNVRGKFGIVCYPTNTIDKEVIEAASDLKVVCTVSAGFEHLDIHELKARGIRIGYSPVDDLTEAVAEHAIGILIATSRRIVETQLIIMNGGWTNKELAPTWMCGYGLKSSTVSILGCGRIGISIMKKLRSFYPERIFYYSHNEKSEANALGGELKPIDYIMKESDFIILALPLSEETKEIIDKERINCMKPNAIIVNIGRGGLINENALIEALQNKKIRGAGLDVFAKEPLSNNNPLLQLNNVVITPHIAGATIKARTVMAQFAALNVIAVFQNEKMPAEV